MTDFEARENPVLHLQLRALRRVAPPDRDLWRGIEARLTPAPASTMATSRRRALPPVFALAATLAVVFGVAGWWAVEGHSPGPPTVTADRQTPVQREAVSLSRHYEAAMLEVAAAERVPSTLQSAYRDLDHNLELIRSALRDDPDSRLLLKQLHRTYDQRLALARRTTIG